MMQNIKNRTNRMAEVKARHTVEELQQGTKIPADNGNPVDKKPPWCDQSKLDRVKDIFVENCGSVLFSHLSGLILVFLYTSLVEPFIYTRKSENISALRHRYLSTSTHVAKWYLGDIWDPGDPAHKSILVVRNMHKNVADVMDDPKNEIKAPNNMLFFSQSGMTITQFTFISWMVCFPKEVGLYCNKEDFECLLHHWRCVGYLLGIDENFNICDGNYEESKSLFMDIMEREIKPGILKPREDSVAMSRDIAIALGEVIPCLSWLALKKYWFEILNLPIDFSLGTYDLLCYWLYHFMFKVLLKYEFTRRLINGLIARFAKARMFTV